MNINHDCLLQQQTPHNEAPAVQRAGSEAGMRLVLAADRAGRWVVWSDDTEDTAGLLESLSHVHLVEHTHTASDRCMRHSRWMFTPEAAGDSEHIIVFMSSSHIVMWCHLIKLLLLRRFMYTF